MSISVRALPAGAPIAAAVVGGGSVWRLLSVPMESWLGTAVWGLWALKPRTPSLLPKERARLL